jgi:hypothetical protein
MSREGALCGARERARQLEEALGHGAVAELLGVRMVVLFAEPATRGKLEIAAGAAPGAANTPYFPPDSA